MNANRNFLGGRACPVMAATSLSLGLNMASAAPVCDDNGGLSPYICVDKDGVPAVHGFHFVRDFSDPANPDITLFTGNLGWKVWSQVSVSDTTPANIGDILIDASVAGDDFEVAILDDLDGPGAANVGSIILSDAANWTGHPFIANERATCLTHPR